MARSTTRAKYKPLIDDELALIINTHRQIIGYAAIACGLIAAACVTGFASITCRALSDTYLEAIHGFGITAVLCFLTFFGFTIAELLGSKSFVTRISSGSLILLSYVGTLSAVIYLTVCVDASLDNLGLSTDHCYLMFDNEKQHTRNLMSQIHLSPLLF